MVPLVVVVAGLITVQYILGRPHYHPYSCPHDQHRPRRIANVAWVVLTAMRWIAPAPTNYLFPKATVIMPTHPISNPYSRVDKTMPWPKWLDEAWHSQYVVQEITPEPREQVTALHVSAGGGNFPGMMRQIALGANIKAKDIRGQTPCYWAAYYGMAGALATLKMHGADLAEVDHRGKSPLRAAVKYHHLMAVDVLAAFGVPLDVRDGRGLTPLHLAAYKGNAAMYRTLTGYGADPTIPDPTGRTALQIFQARWKENYNNSWWIVRRFRSSTPPDPGFAPHTLTQLKEKRAALARNIAGSTG